MLGSVSRGEGPMALEHARAGRDPYLAVFGSALAYTAYTWLLKHAPADRVATFAYVNPAIATVLGWVLLDERLSGPQMAGTLVVLCAVALVTLPAQQPRRGGDLNRGT